MLTLITILQQCTGLLPVCTVLFLFLVYNVLFAFKRPPNFPPGLARLPIYGSYWIIQAAIASFGEIGAAFIKLGHKYSTPVVAFYVGQIPAVVVNRPDLIPVVLNNRDCDGRGDILLVRLRAFWKILGIFFTDGYFWHVQRRFSLRYMRDYGFGRRDDTLESVLARETREIIDIAQNGPKYPHEQELVKGNTVLLPELFAAPYLNALLHVFTRTTLPRSEYPELLDITSHGIVISQNSGDLGRALSITPWIKDVLPELSGYKALTTSNQKLLDFAQKLITKAKATHDKSFDRHFIDKYIRQINDNGGGSQSTFTDQQLALVLVDFILPTTSSLNTVTAMLIDRLLLQPEVQDKIHEEIDRIVGKDRAPTLDDRQNMPYTECCIRETLRLETPLALGVPHRSMEDIQLAGYSIPKNTLMAVNYVSLHTDMELWGDPECFRPERFIVDGKFCPAKDKSMPFGAGRRLCAGETFSRQNLFLVITTFLQTFRVTPASEVKPKRIPGIITTISPFWVRIEPRL